MTGVVENQPAYILHRRLYRESSYLLDVFTLNHGRLAVVAKGATRGKKNKSGLLQVFQPLLLDWTGRSALKNLVNVEAPAGPFNLVSRFLYCGFYLNELILKLCPELEANPELFVCYADTLSKLNKQSNIEAVLRHFECQMLTLLGLAPDFSCSESGEMIDLAQRYRLAENGRFVILGKVPCESSGPNDMNGFSDNELAASYSGTTLQCLSNGWFEQHRDLKTQTQTWSEQQTKEFFREAKSLMRHLIDQALQGQALNSRELFKHIVRGG